MKTVETKVAASKAADLLPAKKPKLHFLKLLPKNDKWLTRFALWRWKGGVSEESLIAELHKLLSPKAMLLLDVLIRLEEQADELRRVRAEAKELRAALCGRRAGRNR